MSVWAAMRSSTWADGPEFSGLVQQVFQVREDPTEEGKHYVVATCCQVKPSEVGKGDGDAELVSELS